MRSDARRPARAALLLLLGLVLLPTAARAASPVSTGVFRVEAPAGPWKRAADLDPPGRLSWAITDPGATTAQLRVEFAGVRATSALAAIEEILRVEKATILARSTNNARITHGEFVTDSLQVDGLRWVGFRVHVTSGDREGEVQRWVALHPEFPQRRRAFVVALDEQTLPKARSVPRSAAALALLRSLTPTGAGLKGGIAEAYLDARASAFAAHIDTTTRMCWRRQGDDAARPYLGVAIGLAGDGDFFQAAEILPADSLVDPASPDYGVGFDRNGDGKIDLIVMNRGIAAAKGALVQPIVAVLADDDFDGRIDGSIVETGDADGDGRADHRLLVLDTDHDGKPDHAVRFVDDSSDRANRALSLKDGVVGDILVGSKTARLDFVETWRDGDRLLARWNALRASCAH